MLNKILIINFEIKYHTISAVTCTPTSSNM